MGDIKKTSLGSDVKVFCDDAGGIMNWHFVTRKRHHLGAELKVQVVKWSAFHLI